MKTLLYPFPESGENIQYSSGMLYSIRKSLEFAGFNVVPVGPLKIEKSMIHSGMNLLYRKGLFPYQFATVHSWKTINGYAAQLQKIVQGIPYDAIFCQSSLYAGALKVNKPIFSFIDFSFFNLLDYYDVGKNLFPSSRKQALAVDKYCFENNTKVFISSDWAKNTTLKAYGLDKSKIEVVKQGANVESGYSFESVSKLIDKRWADKERNFLFVGVKWQRKGGDTAVKIVSKLRDWGYNVKLQVVGVMPPKGILSLPFVEAYGFLRRSDKDELMLFNKLYNNAFCFILPTKAEAMALSFAEAASFGLLSLTNNTGGVGEAVEDKVTGFLFNPEDNTEEMAAKIKSCLDNYSIYKEMSINAYENYKKELNWNSVALKIKQIITPLI